jgi:hypothetical protein
LPTSLKAKTSPFLSPSTQRPAESYPRYSRRESPVDELLVGHKAEGSQDSTIDEGIEDIFAVSVDQIVDITENSTSKQSANIFSS